MTESIGTWVTRGRTELRLSTADLACAAQLAEDRVATIEADRGDGTLHELGQLSKVLGYDLAGWDPEEEAVPRPFPTVQTLFKSADRTLPVDQWPRVLEIAEVAREIVTLERLLDLPDRMEQLRRTWSPDAAIGDPPWKDGQRLAQRLRTWSRLQNGVGYCESVREVCERLGVSVIESVLPDGIDALCFADDTHGPVIVVDVSDDSVHVLMYRFRLAHELCHVLFDRFALDPLQRFDRFLPGDDKPPIERRADAFAIHFLAPEEPFRSLWSELLSTGAEPEVCVRACMERFGTSFQATRAHARHLNLLSMDDVASLSYVDPTPPQRFVAIERDPTSDKAFSPLHRERRGRLLLLTLSALFRGLISRSRALELLRVDSDVFAHRGDDWARRLGIAR